MYHFAIVITDRTTSTINVVVVVFVFMEVKGFAVRMEISASFRGCISDSRLIDDYT